MSPWCVPNPDLCLVLTLKVERDTEVPRVAKCRSAQGRLGFRGKGRGEAHRVPREAGKGCLSLAGTLNSSLVLQGFCTARHHQATSNAPAPLQSDISATACLEQVPTPPPGKPLA